MKLRFKKQISLLFAGSLSMVLAACYGVPVDMQNSITIKTVTENNDPIAGLKITLDENGSSIDSSTTDSLGNVFYPVIFANEETTYSIKIEDIDSTLNLGEFVTKTIELDGSNSNYEITMQE